MIKQLFAVALLSAAISTTSISASASPADTQLAAAQAGAKTFTDSAGRSGTVRSLTAAEVRALHLPGVDAASVRIKAPSVMSAGAARATRSTGVTAAASTSSLYCWSATFGYGTSLLYGKTHVNWCSKDLHWVSYSNSGCYGGSSFPTYKYEGCFNYPNFGVGWNLYQVYTKWTLCYAWLPLWSNCIGADHPHEQYQFLASGKILWNGGS